MTSIEIVEEASVEDTSITQLIKKWKDEEHSANFDSKDCLIRMCKCLEQEQTEFWGRDQDPFDEVFMETIPVAGIYADICKDLISYSDFIFDLITKFITPSTNNQNDCIRHMLRLLCSVLNCYSLSTIFPKSYGDSKGHFYNKIFEWAMGEEMPNNVYSTYILGHIIAEDNHVIPQRKASYIKLVEVTMSRLKTLNQSCTANANTKWFPVRQSPHYFDEGSNASLHDMPMSKIFGEWKLSSPMHKTMQAQLLIYFLRHIAKIETMMTTMYNGGVLSLMSSWLHVDRHDDIRLTFEALRLLMKLLRHRLIRTEFNDSMNGIQLLLNVPRPSVAANAVSFCLYNLLYYDEIVDKVILLPHDKLENLITVILWVIETCHPSARCYGMLCVQCLIRKPITRQIFDEHNGPRYIFYSLATLHTTSENQDKTTRNDSVYFVLLKNMLNTMKICLEQSLISWSMEVENLDATGLLAFPSESEISFSKTAANAIPLAMKLQTWKHPYISDHEDIIKIIYSSTGSFKDAFCSYNGITNPSLDILSLLCISDKFVRNFLDFKDSDTKATVKLIFSNIIRKQHYSIDNHVEGLKSILFFLSILCCRPVQGGRTPVAVNKSSKKRPSESESDPINSSTNASDIISDKDHISDHRLVTRITTIDQFVEPDNTNQELQTKLWSLVRDYNAIPKLLKVLEKYLSPLDRISVRTWVCHVLSGLSRCSDILMMLKKMPIFNRGVLEKYILKKVTPERMMEHAEFCSTAQRLLRSLHGEEYMRPDQVHKAEIVGRTLVQWDRKELLGLIHQHLQNEGLNEVADLLRRDCDLPVRAAPGNISVYEDTATEEGMYEGASNCLLCSTPKGLAPRDASANGRHLGRGRRRGGGGLLVRGGFRYRQHDQLRRGVGYI